MQKISAQVSVKVGGCVLQRKVDVMHVQRGQATLPLLAIVLT